MKKYIVAGIALLVTGIATASIGPKKNSDNFTTLLITQSFETIIKVDSTQLKSLPIGISKIINNNKIIYCLKTLSSKNSHIIHLWEALPALECLSHYKSISLVSDPKN